MFSTVKHIVSVFCVVLMLFAASACTPAQEQQVITDIQDVVNEAASVISALGAFGVLSTPQEQADFASALSYIQKLSAASSQAVTEANSSDSWNVKVNVIAGYFAPIAPPSIATAKILALVQVATDSVKTLLDQLGLESSSLKSLSVKAKTATGTKLSFHARRQLSAIKVKADANVAAANKLLAAAK